MISVTGEVGVAIPEGCDLTHDNCPFGFAVVDGCAICECFQNPCITQVSNVLCGSLFSEPCWTRIAPLGRDQCSLQAVK